MSYRHRVVDTELRAALTSIGAVVIEGPRACGKTWTAEQVKGDAIRMDEPASRQLFQVAPRLVLQGAPPKLIDEWQVEPDLWNLVRREVDDRGLPGQFILTGSAVPRDDVQRHSGAGRFLHLRMRPMTLAESGHSARSVSFESILEGEPVEAPDPGLSIADVAQRVVVGGWPTHLSLSPAQALRNLRGYLEDVANVDVQRLDGVRRDPDGITRLIASLARNIGTPAALETLAADARGSDRGMKPETVASYLDALSRLLLVEDVPAWSPSLRSRTRLRGTPIRQIVDPSLATAALNVLPERLTADPESLKWFGFLFESMVIRDLRVYAQSHQGRVFHFRDERGHEVDAVVELPDGRWAAFEVKLASSGPLVEEGAASLLKLARNVSGKAPLALAVITATGFAFRRADGVLQVPIGALQA